MLESITISRIFALNGMFIKLKTFLLIKQLPMGISCRLDQISPKVGVRFRHTLVLSLILSINTAAFANPPASAEESPTQAKLDAASEPMSEVIALLKDPSKIAYEDVTTKLRADLAVAGVFRLSPIEHQALLEHYRKNLTVLAEVYPDLALNQDLSVIQSFAGLRPLNSFDVHYLPFVPIIPEAAYDLDNLCFFKFSIKVPGTDPRTEKKIYGLKMQSTLPAKEHSVAAYSSIIYKLQMSYISSLNARVLGFSHARVIADLSPNVVPAEEFEYNGLHGWQDHSRYTKEQQFNQPIKLTNVAHASGARFDISSHPDFALTGKLVDQQPIHVTFFLWRSRGKLLWVELPVADGEPPDFIFQLELFRPGAILTSGMNR